MREIQFLVIGENEEILQTLKRVIQNNEGWFATILTSETFSYDYVEKHNFDILLLSSGLEQAFENSVKEYMEKSGKSTKVIEHYGGGSGLLKNEVYQLFPDLDV